MQSHFRFLDLPIEIRFRVYEVLLCSYDPVNPLQIDILRSRMQDCDVWLYAVPPGSYPDVPEGIHRANRSLVTAILRVSKQVHCEAYDVMVKKNRFVHVQSSVAEFSDLLMASQLPVVTMDRIRASLFKDYVLKVCISYIAAASEELPEFSLIITGSAWERFCQVLGEADATVETFYTLSELKLNFNTFGRSPPAAWKAPITDLFLAKVQESMLQPFRKYLQNYEAVSIQGAVDQQLAETVMRETQLRDWTVRSEFLHHLLGQVKAGAHYSHEKEYGEAHYTWRRVLKDIVQTLGRITINKARDIRFVGFFNRIAEIQFITLLHMTTNQLAQCHANHGSTEMRRVHMALEHLEEAEIVCPSRLVVGPDGDREWQAPAALWANLLLLLAVCSRLREDRIMAFDYIEDAIILAPDNPEIIKERNEILWMETGY